jgi:hypothetical protein
MDCEVRIVKMDTLWRCPQKAIQHGKKTFKYQRYPHPEVTLKDMLEQAKANKV